MVNFESEDKKSLKPTPRGKQVSVQVSNDMLDLMRQWKHKVNWSAVCRNAIMERLATLGAIRLDLPRKALDSVEAIMEGLEDDDYTDAEEPSEDDDDASI